jgi:ABC-2 type transport system permease protein
MKSQTLTAHHAVPFARMSTHRVNTLLIYYAYLLRRGLRTAVIWGAAIAAYTAALILSFPAVKESLSVQTYPEALQQAFNMSDLSHINGYLAVEVFTLLPLVVALYPIISLAGAIAGAEERGRLDVLLGTPLSRRDLLIASFAATATLLAGIVVVLGVSGWLTGVAADIDLAFGDIMGASLALWPISMFFGGVALAVSSVARRFAIAAGVAIGALMAMYGLDTIGKIAENETVRWISAFRWYGDPIQQGIDWPGSLGLIAATILLGLVALVQFDRRDIYT